jgi:hypothetical protein
VREQNASDTYPPSPATTTLGSKQLDIKTYMTPNKQRTTRVNEIIEISNNESTNVRQQRPTDMTVQTTTTIPPTHLPELGRASIVTCKTVEEESITVDRVDNVQPTTILPTTDPVANATTDTVVEHSINDNRIVQATVEASVDTTPQVSTPPQTIDQILANTPALTERDAAETLGELATTTIEGLKTGKDQKKIKATTAMSIPAMSAPKTRQTRRRIQERI